LSLRDVTARELREQRLSVLNRVLRHNLRNKLEVVKTHTEIIHEELDGEYETHTETLAETTDDIADLGRNARRIDQFVASDSGATAVDIVSAIEETLTAVDTDDTDVDITVDAPVSAPVETNRRALTAALRSALENAVTYAETAAEVTVERDGTGWRVLIVDDGPGIPSSELDSLDDGVETPLSHGTGLGLWQLKWAVTTLGGQLSFDTANGTTVEMTVPDRSQA
jgi:signal transduction histidine kinase